VKRSPPTDLAIESWRQKVWQDGEAAFVAFSARDADGARFEVNVLHAQLAAFFNAQACAIDDSGHESRLAAQPGQNARDLSYLRNGLKWLALE